MTLFWILAAALVVVVLLALVRPLLKPGPGTADRTSESNLRILREQLAELDADLAVGTIDAEHHAAARAELERRVLEESRVADTKVAARSGTASAVGLALAVPALAVVLYVQLGNQGGLDPVLAKSPSQATPADIDVLVQRLADRMQADPSDPEGWILLGRSYAGLQRFAESRDAFAQAVARLKPPSAQVLADYADVMAMTAGSSLAGEPERLVMQALALDPDHLKSLALAGSAAMERGDYAAAVRHWSRAKAVAPPGSPFATDLDPVIAEARAAAGLPPETVTATPAAAANGPGLQVTVTLDPALSSQLQAGDTLFVFARAAEGPRMPLAIVRQPAVPGPVEVTLDDASAMSPQLKLSGFPRVVVGARISRSGNATPQAGDLEGGTEAIGSQGKTQVFINRIRE
jgi:cytochrome c-type biogenesis protein CcmH